MQPNFQILSECNNGNDDAMIGGFFQIRLLEQNQQKELSLSLPLRRKKLDSTDSAESTASSNSNNGGGGGGERSNVSHGLHRGRSGRSVKPVPVLTPATAKLGTGRGELVLALCHIKTL